MPAAADFLDRLRYGPEYLALPSGIEPLSPP
jgi:hypothetical protein